MSLDQLMEAVSRLAGWLLPVVGVVLLVYLILFVRTLTETLKDLSLTLLTAQNELSKLDGPLNTLDELSHTVDEVHAAAKKMASQAAEGARKGMENVSEWFKHTKEEAAEATEDVKRKADFAAGEIRNAVEDMNTPQTTVVREEDIYE